MDVGGNLVEVVENGVRPGLRYGARSGLRAQKIWIR